MALREERKQQTRQALIDAALELMHRGGGFSSLSLREISREAGLVPTGFYRHFADLDALGLEIAHQACAELRHLMQAARAQARGGHAAVSESVHAMVRFMDEQPLLMGFLTRERGGGIPAIREAIAEEIQTFVHEQATDLARWPVYQNLPLEDRLMIAELVVNTVIQLALDLPSQEAPDARAARLNRTIKQLRLVMLGALAWRPEKGAISPPAALTV